MEKVTLGGKVYEKASVLARELGYTTDYIGQLCRADKVDAQLVGRSWYVTAKSLEEHKTSRYRSSKATSQKAFKEKVIEAKTVGEEAQWSHYKKGPVMPASYNTDETDLIPTPKKAPESANEDVSPVEIIDAREVETENSIRIRKIENAEPKPTLKPVSAAHFSLQTQPKEQKLQITRKAPTVANGRFSTTPTDAVVRIPRKQSSRRVSSVLTGSFLLLLCFLCGVCSFFLVSEVVATEKDVAIGYALSFDSLKALLPQ